MQPDADTTAAWCSTASENAEIRVCAQRALELLEACSARGLELTNVTAVLLYTCGGGPENSRVIHGFIDRALELLATGPGAASLRHLAVDAVPVRASDPDVELEFDDLADDSKDTWPFAVWPVVLVPEELGPRWRPTAADVARLLRPFRSLRRLSLAPYGGLISSSAAGALAAALPDLRALRLGPASDESLPALAPLPLELLSLGAQISGGSVDFPVGEGLARLAEGRAGGCLESIYLEWPSLRPAALWALARMPHLKQVMHATVPVHPAPGIPEALASLRSSASLAELCIRLPTDNETDESAEAEVAALLRALAEAAAAPALEYFDLDLSGPEIKPDELVALLQAARRSLRLLSLHLWDRCFTREEIAAIVDVAATDGKLRYVSVECEVESQKDINTLKPLRALQCPLLVWVDLAAIPKGFGAVTSAAGLRRLLSKVKARLEQALPNADVEVQSKLLEEGSDPEDWF